MMESIPDAWIPLVIFIGRIFDVGLGTLRVLFVTRGLKVRASFLGFCEVLIWTIVIVQLIQHLNNWVNYVVYTGGYSPGISLGITLENKLKVGPALIRIITYQHASELIESLKKAGIMITSVDATKCIWSTAQNQEKYLINVYSFPVRAAVVPDSVFYSSFVIRWVFLPCRRVDYHNAYKTVLSV